MVLHKLSELLQEEAFLAGVTEGPVLKESIDQWCYEGPVFHNEKHGASNQLFEEVGQRLDLVEGNDNVVEEGDVLLPQGHGVTGND